MSYVGPVLAIVAAFALVLVNGVFVAAEFAIVRVRRTRLEELAGQGIATAKHAIEMVDEVSDYLTSIQVGITATSLGVGWLGEHAIAQALSETEGASDALVHGVASVIAFGVMTTLHVVVGEIVPKNMAIAKADRYVLALARPLRAFHRIVQPASRVFATMAAWIARHFGIVNLVPAPLSEHELKLVLEDSHEDGVVTAGEARIIMRAFEFADRRAEQIMVPAERVDYLSLARSFEENLEVARKNRHARLPLGTTDLDSIRGVVSLKDVWLLQSGGSNEAFERACRPVTKIPFDLSQELILKSFQADKAQFGVVRDAGNRRTLGIVTLEDVLDSLLGDVREAKTFWPAPRV